MTASMFENLPEDPERIFLVVEQRFREDLERKTEKVDWEQYFPSTECMEYIRRTTSAAQELGLSFLLDYDVPNARNLSSDAYLDFRGIVDHYSTALHLRHARRDSGYSVKFDITAKRKIAHFIQNIREIIVRLEIDDWKREALLNRLNALQEEVDRDRFRFQIFAALIIESAGVTIDPIRFKFEKLNSYIFFLGGFRIIAVLDGQELPPHFDGLIINRTGIFRGSYYDFDGSPEQLKLSEMIIADKKWRQSAHKAD